MIARAGPLFVDTHAHMDDAVFGDDLERVVAEATTSGVSSVINIGYRPAMWASTIALPERFPGFSFTLGIHPNHAEEATPETLAELRRLVLKRKPVAIGEIGLDYYRTFASPVVQRRAFAAQLELAVETGLPVVIHQRSAESDFLEMIGALPPTATLILHSFDGSDELLQVAIDQSYPVGVGGLMTRPGSTLLREQLRRTPRDLLLLETDSPYLKPSGIRGSRNTPATIPKIAESLARLLDDTVAEIAELTTANAARVFGVVPFSLGAST